MNQSNGTARLLWLGAASIIATAVVAMANGGLSFGGSGGRSSGPRQAVTDDDTEVHSSGCLESNPTFWDYSAMGVESPEADQLRAQGFTVLPGNDGWSCIYDTRS